MQAPNASRDALRSICANRSVVTLVPALEDTIFPARSGIFTCHRAVDIDDIYFGTGRVAVEFLVKRLHGHTAIDRRLDGRAQGEAGKRCCHVAILHCLEMRADDVFAFQLKPPLGFAAWLTGKCNLAETG